jgi:hypothetical protein
MVPALSEENVYSGVESLVGVVTAVTSASVTADESTTNDVIVIESLTYPDALVTLIVQSE